MRCTRCVPTWMSTARAFPIPSASWKLRRAAEAAKEAAANQEDPAVRIGELRDQLPAGVLSEYDTQREENGVGAAQFKANRACGGCFIVLPPAEQNAVRNAPADELPQCGDCGSYLVRLV